MPDAPAVTLADLVSDPHAALSRMRERGSVVEMDMGTAIIGYEALRTALHDARLRPSFSDFLELFGVTSGPFYDWMKASPLDMDGAEHRRWRQLMSRAFTPRSVEHLRPFLRSESARLAGQVAALGECDFVAEFARKLPALGLCELVGVPPEGREAFGVWADTIGLGFNPMMMASRIAEIDGALLALLDYAGRLVEERRKEPRDDLVTRIAEAVDEEGGFPEELVRGSVAGLVFAGHETTKNQLGWMVAVLSEVPAEWDRVAADPARAPAVIEEVLRFRSTVTSVGRTASEDLDIEGVAVKGGARVMGYLWGVNRDPSAFAAPDRFDVEANRSNPQLAFGHGAHHCLGAALARAELQEALVALTRAVRCPTLRPGATFLPPLGINGPLTLPVAVEPRA